MPMIKLAGTDVEQPVESFKTREEMDARAKALRDEGFTVLPMDNPRHGLAGFVAFLVPASPESRGPEWDEKARALEWPVYGSRLLSDEVTVKTADQLVEAYKAHEGHETLRPHVDPVDRTLGFVCYCRAHEGRSSLITVPLSRLQEMESLPDAIREEVMKGIRK